jgi:hypothetical protein
VPRIIKHLPKMFPVARYPKGVPSPALAPRKGMIKDLLNNADLGGSLDEGTLKKAIDQYNKSL